MKDYAPRSLITPPHQIRLLCVDSWLEVERTQFESLLWQWLTFPGGKFLSPAMDHGLYLPNLRHKSKSIGRSSSHLKLKRLLQLIHNTVKYTAYQRASCIAQELSVLVASCFR